MEKMEFKFNPAMKEKQLYIGLASIGLGIVGGLVVSAMFGLVFFGILSLFMSSTLGRDVLVFSDESVKVRQAPLTSVKDLRYEHIESIEVIDKKKINIKLKTEQSLSIDWNFLGKEDRPLIIEKFAHYIPA
ncbi:hypothetical protein KO495_13855 [Colwellia sp. D2M02]|uniref:hypothetical protein n=1 Tax=Colwellia sp. D2M02 TaxID=2841562 RepID=UPI001C07FD6E|nr:hypothetical protein [Colwellia sp. D2M02]MBU2894395.1 hypothetical protein [Colwellia sp. D2M02]